MLRLDGKIALVTGCGSMGEGWGNGKAISVLLARQGTTVFGVDLNMDAALETRAVIEREGFSATVRRCDVTEASEVEAAVNACLEAGRTR